MKDVFLLLGVIAVALAITAAAVFGLGDRETLVPPPEAVAESFTREIAERRYDLALEFLSDERRKDHDASTLRAQYEPILQRVGVMNQVSAETDWMDLHTASATSTVNAKLGSVTLQLGFVRERGLWRIDGLPRDPTVAVDSSSN